MTKRLLIFFGCALLFLATLPACKKQEEIPPAAPATNQAIAPTPSADLPPQKLSVQSGDNIDAVLEDLSKELRKWVRRNQRVPASFEEFVSSAQLQPPPPPAGKKYIINRSKMSVALGSK